MVIITFVLAALAFGPTEGKVMATDDWITLSILEVGTGPASSPHHYVRVAAGDLDGDGVADQAALRLVCDGAKLKQADYAVTGPRDASSGQPSGKRMHKPIRVVTEWNAASPEMMAVKPTYDVKKVEGSGARQSSGDGWSPISLANTDGLCGALARATKTRSNIQNN